MIRTTKGVIQATREQGKDTVINVSSVGGKVGLLPELRNPVGKDADSIFKTRAELSDKEMEQWSREAYMDKKGFIRQ